MAFGIRSIPATFLVGKGGRIVASNLRGPDLEAAIEKALAGELARRIGRRAVSPPLLFRMPSPFPGSHSGDIGAATVMYSAEIYRDRGSRGISGCFFPGPLA